MAALAAAAAYAGANGQSGVQNGGAITPPLPTPFAATVPVLAPVTPHVVVASPPPEAAAAPDAPSDLGGSLNEVQEVALSWQPRLFALADHARTVAPEHPWGYRVARLAAWLTVDEAPPHEEGRTYVDAPKPKARATIEQLVSAGHWDVVLTECEEAFSRHIYWLDLQWYAARALEHLGRRAAREALGREVAALLTRAPQLPELAFRNGTPFASPEARGWLSAERARFEGGGGGGKGGSDPELDALFEELGTATSAQAFAKALSSAPKLASGRSKFRARLGVARRALEGGDADLAVALARSLHHEVTPALEAWEPELAAECLALLLEAERASRREASLDASMFERLLTLDANHALRIRGLYGG